MPNHQVSPTRHAPGGALAGATIITVVALTLGGCGELPRDTSATPAPPRQPVSAGDDVYPAPRSERDTRPPPAR